jgi:hypothetical protein
MSSSFWRSALRREMHGFAQQHHIKHPSVGSSQHLPSWPEHMQALYLLIAQSSVWPASSVQGPLVKQPVKKPSASAASGM